ncbi:hypothetical protein [Pontibacter sp. G13]|uniref:hypothetical protein n=1 Tax=Pontibacter sp. G13 TaxID=3074898 RepID=UPI002889ED52|nr:hypothetical protein [Pontibacter sp. G13]WNJ21395.1 hypothetical protein RJD25_13080 [Pontibacter sp. G13]
MKISRFVPILSIVAAALVGLAFAFVAGTDYSMIAIGLAILVAFVPTIFAYIITYWGLDKDSKRFMGFLLTGMMAKMLVGILSIVLVAIRFSHVRNEYVVAYMVSYFVFTAFEVYGLIRKLRPNF